MKLLTLSLTLATLLLCGCATCREHPVGCAVVTGIVAASVALTIDQHHHEEPFAHNCVEYYEQRYGATPVQAAHDCR